MEVKRIWDILCIGFRENGEREEEEGEKMMSEWGERNEREKKERNESKEGNVREKEERRKTMRKYSAPFEVLPYTEEPF